MRLLFALFITTSLAFAEELPLVPLPELAPLSQDLLVKDLNLDEKKNQESIKNQEPLKTIESLKTIETEKAVEINIPPQEQPVTIILPPKACAALFTKAINDLETSARLPLLDFMNASKKGDYTLNRAALLPVPNDLNGKDWGEIARLTRIIAQGNGIDPALYTTAIVGDILYRSVHELKAFTTQKEVAGICANVKPFTSFYKERNSHLFQRNELYQRLRTLVYDELKKSKSDFIFTMPDVLEREIRVALFDEIKTNKLSGRNAQLASLLAWLSEGQSRVGGLADKLNSLMNDIEQAHARDCDCKP